MSSYTALSKGLYKIYTRDFSYYGQQISSSAAAQFFKRDANNADIILNNEQIISLVRDGYVYASGTIGLDAIPAGVETLSVTPMEDSIYNIGSVKKKYDYGYIANVTSDVLNSNDVKSSNASFVKLTLRGKEIVDITVSNVAPAAASGVAGDLWFVYE